VVRVTTNALHTGLSLVRGRLKVLNTFFQTKLHFPLRRTAIFSAHPPLIYAVREQERAILEKKGLTLARAEFVIFLPRIGLAGRATDTTGP